MKTVSLIISAAALSVALSGVASAAHKDTRYDRRYLSKHEAVQDAMRSFRHLDRNHNGVLRYKEVKRSHYRGVGHRDRGYSKHDDGWYIDIGYRDYYRDRRGRTANVITIDNFHKFDKNGDHKITKHELKKRVKKKFDKADLNYDGYLSRREIERSNFFSKIYDSRGDYDYRDRDRDRDRDRNRDRDRDGRHRH